MGIKCKTYEVNPGTFLFDFEIVSSPDDHRSLADRLKEIYNDKYNDLSQDIRLLPDTAADAPALKEALDRTDQ